VIPVERLTAEDEIMLWPDELWPQEIGALAVLDGSCLLEPGGRFRIEAVRQTIEARLHLVPRFRQLLRVPPRGLGRPLWVDAPAFDLADHVRVAPLAAPGDEAQLLLATEQLRRCRLDRSRPLWEMWFLPGLPDGRIGLFVKMHHAIADGIAGVATVGEFLDAGPDVPAATAPPWTPAPLPTARDLFADNLHRHAEELRRAFSTLARPVPTLRSMRAAWPAMRELLAAEPAPATSLNRVVGADRNLALIRGGLDQVRQVAHAHHATVNDVLLAVTAGGLRGLLHGRGEPVDDLSLRVYVPVTLRPAQLRGRARGNRIGQMVVPLPVGMADPGRLLARIAAETAARKAKSHPSVGTVLRSRIARRVLLKVLDRQPVNITTADIPGPPRPRYLAGARLLEVFPVLPLVANVSLGVGALSYAEQFNIMAVADRNAFPDLEVFASNAEEELRALVAGPGSGLSPSPPGPSGPVCASLTQGTVR
jgi:WS/DGAT/MGAT family acyltransferase